MQEKVLVINRHSLIDSETHRKIPQNYDSFCKIFHNDKWKGTISPYDQASLIENGFFVDRDIAEDNEELLQIIPYVVITCDNKYLLYRRTKSGGESRLHEKLSIGIGGHINTEDLIKTFSKPSSNRTRMTDILMNGVFRELREELEWESVSSPWLTLNGPIIYDGTTKVGRVHLGLAMHVSVPNQEEISLKEEGLSNLEWKTIFQLDRVKDKLEEWSSLYLQERKRLEERLSKTPEVC